ncbi:MAG: hypothetical protein GC159_04715 [Phycisphaera sp.]|nr:hypothetical protein [Phycisphaera sp.]
MSKTRRFITPLPQGRGRRHRRGFATIAAMMLVVLVGLAITALMTRLKNEADATRDAIAETELRQMLIAGALASPRLAIDPRPNAIVPADAPKRRDRLWLDLPPAFAERNAAIVLTVHRDRRNLEKHIVVEARLDGRVAYQTLRYVRGETGWGLAEGTLGDRDEDNPLNPDVAK